MKPNKIKGKKKELDEFKKILIYILKTFPELRDFDLKKTNGAGWTLDGELFACIEAAMDKVVKKKLKEIDEIIFQNTDPDLKTMDFKRFAEDILKWHSKQYSLS